LNAEEIDPLSFLYVLREEVRRDEISVEEAWKEMNNVSKTKMWGSFWWKKERSKVIGNCCEQCGSERKPLVLQHLWQPPIYKDLKKEITGYFYGYFKVNFGMRRKPKRKHFYEIFGEDIKKVIVFSMINHRIRYYSFIRVEGKLVDVVTFCSKCARLWDIEDLRLCPRCRGRYYAHKSCEPLCEDCLRWMSKERCKLFFKKMEIEFDLSRLRREIRVAMEEKKRSENCHIY